MKYWIVFTALLFVLSGCTKGTETAPEKGTGSEIINENGQAKAIAPDETVEEAFWTTGTTATGTSN